MRFILLHLGQTGHKLFFRLTLGVDIGWDKSSRINTSFSSHWFAHTTSDSSHPEVLPPAWPLSVTCGRRSFIYLRVALIRFSNWRQWRCAVREQGVGGLNSDWWRLSNHNRFLASETLGCVKGTNNSVKMREALSFGAKSLCEVINSSCVEK